jgi:hypothetical protein
MDTDEQLIRAVKGLIVVVEELASEHDLSEQAKDGLETAKRNMQYARSQADQDALS